MHNFPCLAAFTEVTFIFIWHYMLMWWCQNVHSTQVMELSQSIINRIELIIFHLIERQPYKGVCRTQFCNLVCSFPEHSAHVCCCFCCSPLQFPCTVSQRLWQVWVTRQGRGLFALFSSHPVSTALASWIWCNRSKGFVEGSLRNEWNK